MLKRINGKLVSVAASAAALATVSTGALATSGGGTDFSGILSGLDGASAVTAIIAAAAILALVGFAKWGAKKVAKFFG